MNRQSMLPSSSPWSFPQRPVSQSCYHVPAFNSQSAQFSTYCWPFTAHLLPFIYSQIIPCYYISTPTQCNPHTSAPPICVHVCVIMSWLKCAIMNLSSASPLHFKTYTKHHLFCPLPFIKDCEESPSPHPSTTTSVPSSTDHTHVLFKRLVLNRTWPLTLLVLSYTTDPDIDEPCMCFHGWAQVSIFCK